MQDEGSQLIGYVVAPRRSDMVVDFCAGAGGKTLLLGALMRSQGRLYAFDVVAKRLANLTPRLARSGLSNVHPQVLTSERDTKVKRLAGKIDRVLVDAPCTGFGTLRRNPDLKWRQPESAVAELAAKQAAILAAAAPLVKPGGRLVYATCSVLPDENEAIVAGVPRPHIRSSRRAMPRPSSRAPASRSTPDRHCGCFRTCTAATDSSPPCWNARADTLRMVRAELRPALTIPGTVRMDINLSVVPAQAGTQCLCCDVYVVSANVAGSPPARGRRSIGHPSAVA